MFTQVDIPVLCERLSLALVRDDLMLNNTAFGEAIEVQTAPCALPLV